MKSTRVKTPSEIKKVKRLYEKLGNIRAVSRITGFSKNTVRLIVRHPEIQKFPKQTRKFHQKQGGESYTSPIDGTKMKLRKTPEGYFRVCFQDDHNRTRRELLHVHEAKKVYKKNGTPWTPDLIVHHVDLRKDNCRLSNLAVLTSSEHQLHHRQMEMAMYRFLEKNSLLPTFLEKNPNLRLRTLDVIKK